MNALAIRDRWLSLLIAGALRLLGMSWRVRRFDAAMLDNALPGGAVLAFWHGEQMVMVYAHRDMGLVGLASRSRDGELLARVIDRLGYGVVRGSSSRGGAPALREAQRMLRVARSPALAVDGPRGPRHRAATGAAALAAGAGRPIVYGVCRAWPVIRLRSWDLFEVPLPFARVDIHYGLMEPPADASRRTLDQATLELDARMVALQERAGLEVIRAETSER